jgi:uncharacterized protein (TIGR02466 family)
MQQPKGEARPLFPAGALARYTDDAFETIPIDDLDFQPTGRTGTSSTDSSINILEDERFARLTRFFRECVADYLDNIVSYDYDDFDIIHAWLNRAGKGAIQPMHYHGNSIVSGVYYLQANRSNAPLIFEKNEINTSPYLAIAPKEQTLFNANRMAFPAESGTCFLFPSNMRHGYDVPNEGPERISLAFNVMLTGIGLSYRV